MIAASTCFRGFARHGAANAPGRSGALVRRIATVVLSLTVFLALPTVARGQQVAAIDAAGNVDIATEVSSTGAPITAGAYQSAFAPATCQQTQPYIPYPCGRPYIQRISPDGATLLAATYLTGSSEDVVTAIAADAAGNIDLAGTTQSADFPATKGAYQTQPGPAFVSILSADGRTLLHSTFLNLANIYGIAVDSQGRVVVVGSGIPAGTPGALAPNPHDFESQPVVIRFNPSLAAIDYMVWFAGGPAGAGAGVATDAADDVYVFGVVSAQDSGFAAKLNSAGQILWSTAFPAVVFYDNPSTISLDAQGNAYITGLATPADFPVTPGAFAIRGQSPISPAVIGGFAVKLKSDTGAILYSTVIAALDAGSSAVDAAGDLLIAGVATLPTFPSTPAAQHPCFMAGDNNYAYLQLSPDGSRELSGGVIPVPAANRSPLIFAEPNGNILLNSATKYFDIFPATTPAPQGITCVANAASYAAAPIAPGEIVALFGPDIGPGAPSTLQVVNGVVSSSLAGVQVRFGGIPAPLLYVSQNQINAIVPFGIAGQKSVTIDAVNGGTNLPEITLPVAPSATGIFTLDGSGSGLAAVRNQDGSINSSSNPARLGSIIAVFLTGAGMMTPTPVDGSFGEGKTKPILPVSATLNSLPLETTYSGDAPTLVQGAVQVNCRLPAQDPVVGYLELDVHFGAATPNVVWVSVQ